MNVLLFFVLRSIKHLILSYLNIPYTNNLKFIKIENISMSCTTDYIKIYFHIVCACTVFF